MSGTGNLYFVYFIVLLLTCLWGIFYGAHCTNARAQWRLPRCSISGGEFILNRTCFAGGRGAELLLVGELVLMYCRCIVS